MTDQYEPVTAADLKPGDEVEVVFRAILGPSDVLNIQNGCWAYQIDGSTIRRKVRPISVGDRVKDGNGDCGTVLCLHGGDAWVSWDDDERTTWGIANLTRVTP